MTLKGNALLGQSGGPTSVINASLAGLIDAAAEFDGIDRILGMHFGVEGLMAGDVIDLSAESAQTIQALRHTPSSALGSCRHKLTDDDLPKLLAALAEHNVRYVFMIGGNDTMDTICRLEAHAAAEGYELRGIGVPKTVDNDLFGTDHTPGYGSAARYVAMSVRQAGWLARAMQRVDQFVVYQAVGRDSGWLAAASALARQDEGDGPHLIYMPERPFNAETFLADAERAQNTHGWISVVVGEGIAYEDGTPVSASNTVDKFKNVEFGAMGGTSAAMILHRMLTDQFGWRGEFQVTESLQMCAADRASETDVDEAYRVGRHAVKLAADGVTGQMAAFKRAEGDAYSCEMTSAPLGEVAVRAKPMPDEFVSPEGNDVTDAFVDYLRPLVGDLPQYANLSFKKA